MEINLNIKKFKKKKIKKLSILYMIITETNKLSTNQRKIINIKILELKRMLKFKIKNSLEEKKKLLTLIKKMR
jgi:hypothetical protein